MRSPLNSWLVMLVVGGIVAGAPDTKADEATGVVTNKVAATNTVPATDSKQHNLSSDHGGFGLGVIVGEPTGLSMKYWLSHETAVDLGLAWSFEDEKSFHLHGDYLFHIFDLILVDYGELPLYVGVGGRVKVPDHGDTRAGVRLPVGLAYEFPDAPVEIFAEVAPIVDLTPATQLRWNGGVGVRFYFR